MPEPFGVAVGRWWRFEQYEVRDGVIRPAPGASLEPYDPWTPYREARAGNGGQPPYESLLDLVQDTKFQPRPGPGPLRELTPRSEEKLLAWCRLNGLVGVLPHQVIMVRLAPRWAPLEGNQAVLVPTQLQHGRTNEGWVTFDRVVHGARLGSVRDQLERRGELIPPDDAPGGWPQPGVMIQPLGMSVYREERFKKTWSRFFPDVSAEETETHAYPRPLTEEFWRCYAEPVEDFVKAATSLLNAINNLGTAKSAADAVDSDLENIRTGMDDLHSLVRTVSPAIVPALDGALHQGWISTSLLGSLAMMALLDLTESRRVLTCKSCGKLFVTTAYQARYCSSTCRFRIQKQRHRAKQEEPTTDEPRHQPKR